MNSLANSTSANPPGVFAFMQFQTLSPEFSLYRYNSAYLFVRPSWYFPSRSILVPSTFHIASLKRYTPKFSGAPQKLTWCQPFGVQVLPKSGNSYSCTQKKLFLRCFCTKSIFLAKRSIVAYSIPYIFWKLLFQRLIWHIWGPATCILWPVRFFVTLWESTGSISWNLVLT